MNRQVVFIVIVIAAVFVFATAFAQQHRPYNQIMKDVGATFASLKKNLDANSATAAAQDAAKLEGLFAETEAFWAPFDTKDAISFAKRARDAAAAPLFRNPAPTATSHIAKRPARVSSSNHNQL